MRFFWYKYPFNTPGLVKYRFRSISYFLVCISRNIFKESIEGQTQGSTNYFFRYPVTPKPQYLRTQFLAKIIVRYLGLYQNIEL